MSVCQPVTVLLLAPFSYSTVATTVPRQALDKFNLGIVLNTLSLKVMTVYSLPRNLSWCFWCNDSELACAWKYNRCTLECWTLVCLSKLQYQDSLPLALDPTEWTIPIDFCLLDLNRLATALSNQFNYIIIENICTIISMLQCPWWSIAAAILTNFLITLPNWSLLQPDWSHTHKQIDHNLD